MKAIQLVTYLVIAVSLLIIGCSVNVELNLNDIPIATNGQIREWDITTSQLLGIRANDPVASNPAADQQNNTWSLLFPEKKNLGGVFNRYGTEPEGGSILDWNFMIHPFNDFIYIYESAPTSGIEDWPGCIDPNDQNKRCDQSDYNSDSCMLAEIAPDPDFVNSNPWFSISVDHNHCEQGAFLKKKDTLGVYGYPVIDDIHGNNPEIHPAQQIWFRNKDRSSEEKSFYWLMFLQDASNRFQDWVGSPIYGQFHIAFRAKPTKLQVKGPEPLTMNLRIAFQSDLVTNEFPAHSIDDDNGNSHALIVDGSRLVVVNESENLEENMDLGIQFVELAKLADGTVQGYVQVSMVLGDYDTDEIGLCVLELEVIQMNRINGEVLSNSTKATPFIHNK